MERRTRNRVLVALTGAILAGGIAAGTVAAAGGGDDEEPSVTGPEADRASAAALEVTGGGRANSVERDSEDGAVWEVEVTRPDGATVDVRLDGSYRVVVIERDSEVPDDADAEPAGVRPSA
jgi:uncharacterized membrane protein YkoI